MALASQFAPSIIKYFSNSDTAATVAGQVIDIAKTVTGKGTPEESLDALAADPALAIQFKTAVMANDTELEKAYLADRQGARAMQIAALGQDDMFSKRFIYYFIAAWSMFTMVYIGAVTFWPPAEEAGKANSATVLGFLLGTAVASIFSYLFGSTKSSAEKNRLLASGK